MAMFYLLLSEKATAHSSANDGAFRLRLMANGLAFIRDARTSTDQCHGIDQQLMHRQTRQGP
ncbi:hypothetical protein ALQ93_102637 [Pseudomonas syringae pv. pisi]|uniref:Uncharacterized protein n=2 Tax=Pseudomonas syringae group TaxID=136849 RepID=A0A0P9L3N6_9PSED|nr:hypothetical protein ALO76_102438 [Pseudomonas syringae pv. coriandricola]KPY29065.1 hypothetical protein ALO54_102584 [Pseudomonas syringae pv. philadelphi]RML58449.1 hypothetical protein ALQ93_102637 [Pseudomonas syringae pv. pisi]RMM24798.1 hypothetical protein ALQ83_102655 [Pseudomonas syringae pv. berberidis]RMO96668.1 hypothetical protein ALQ31_100916 [Pseudomonas amygdali pv. morsprunorum]RMU71015.1 hypothetical protein ALP24_103161 [Pseudomonas syringae pv. aptata]